MKNWKHIPATLMFEFLGFSPLGAILDHITCTSYDCHYNYQLKVLLFTDFPRVEIPVATMKRNPIQNDDMQKIQISNTVFPLIIARGDYFYFCTKRG